MKWKQLWRRLRGGHLTRRRAAGSVAAGLFIGSLPLYGLHFPLCVAVCVPLSLDLVTAYVAANISNPFVAPFLVAAEVQVGALILEGHFVPFSIEQARAAGIGGFMAQAAVGSVVMGGVLALVGALLSLLVVKQDTPPPDDDLDRAIDRTLTRYSNAPRGDRFYVAAKLHTDPVVRQLAGQGASFGEILDLGTGRGQLALLLIELGLATRFTGLDWDERKVEVCRAAAGASGKARTVDLSQTELPAADTVLLIDVLHYLPLAQQSALLERATAAVRPGGRLVVRELSPQSRVGLWAEQIGARLGMNRGAIGERVSADRMTGRLAALGLRPRRIPHPDGKTSPNYLVIGER